jgi:nucleoside-diphosphate-sugar epimerase
MGATEDHPVKSIAILGANGQIGSTIYQYLRQHYPHAEIKACVRRIPDHQISKDYRAFHPFADNWQTLGETDVLINCIGIIEESKHATFEQAHMGLTKRMLQYRQAIGNPKIIHLSA